MTIQPSDIDNPDWSSTFFQADESMSFDQERHGHAGILTIHGVADLLHNLTEEAAEEVREWMEGGEDVAEMPEWLRAVLPLPVLKPVDTTSIVLPAKAFHTATFNVPAAPTLPVLVSARGDRLRLVVYNSGANPALLSWTDDADNVNTAGQSGWCALPNGAVPGANPREIRAGGKVWVYSTLGTSVDIQEEYGYVYREGGFLST